MSGTKLTRSATQRVSPSCTRYVCHNCWT